MTGEIMCIPQDEVVEKPPTGCSAEDLEAKLRWINEKVPLKDTDVMGSQVRPNPIRSHQQRRTGACLACMQQRMKSQ
jgi:hypothetical protein